MNWEEDVFYAETSEFDRQVGEFKEALLKSVKAEYVAEMDRLRAENEELQKVKRDWTSIQAEYANKHRQLEYEKSHLESKVRSARLVDLLKEYNVTMFSLGHERIEGPKCDNCNENRKILFKSPTGKQLHEDCVCGVSKLVYVPRENILSEINNHGYGKMTAWYKPYRDDGDGITLESSSVMKQVCDANTPFESIERYGAFFRTREDCQAYCDWLNAKSA